MITAADVDRRWHRVPAPVPPVWVISDICLARGEMTIYNTALSVAMTRRLDEQNYPLLT